MLNLYNYNVLRRGGSMKRTYQPNKSKAKKIHGFFARKKADSGVVSARRKKGRKKLTK